MKLLSYKLLSISLNFINTLVHYCYYLSLYVAHKAHHQRPHLASYCFASQCCKYLIYPYCGGRQGSSRGRLGWPPSLLLDPSCSWLSCDWLFYCSRRCKSFACLSYHSDSPSTWAGQPSTISLPCWLIRVAWTAYFVLPGEEAGVCYLIHSACWLSIFVYSEAFTPRAAEEVLLYP